MSASACDRQSHAGIDIDDSWCGSDVAGDAGRGCGCNCIVSDRLSIRHGRFPPTRLNQNGQTRDKGLPYSLGYATALATSLSGQRPTMATMCQQQPTWSGSSAQSCPPKTTQLLARRKDMDPRYGGRPRVRLLPCHLCASSGGPCFCGDRRVFPPLSSMHKPYQMPALSPSEAGHERLLSYPPPSPSSCPLVSCHRVFVSR